MSNYLNLRCLIQGESTSFKVQVKSNEDIDDLKGHVHKMKAKGILRDVDAADLVLWKVRLAGSDLDDPFTCYQLKDPVSVSPKNTFTERVPQLGRDFYVELEDESQTLSELFANPPEKYLHIVVEFTSVGESEQVASPTSWLILAA
jgi:hypothetical protein